MTPSLPGETWTRAQFVRRAGAAGIAAGLAGVGGIRLLDAVRASAAPSSSAGDVLAFESRPDLAPPVLTVVHGDPRRLAPGLLFLAPFEGPRQAGPLIVDNAGEPIWFRPSTPNVTTNLRVASYRGKPVLTWWEGSTALGLGQGTHVIADDTYTPIARFPAGDGLPSDLHEFILSPAGTAFVTSYERVKMDLSPVGGPKDGTAVGSIAQELELPSGRVLFEWRSLDHVPITDSYPGSETNPYDYFHLNSIDIAPDGNLLISSRNTWAVYKVDRGSGEVIWRLGGKRSDFAMGAGARFAWQHDARYHESGGETLVSLFDDGAAPKAQSQSRALVIALDSSRMQATLRHAQAHSPSVLAQALGSYQVLPNGNWLVGWGTAPYLSEYGPAGETLLDMRLPAGRWNYRALRFPWVGSPAAHPTLVARPSSGSTRLYVSWNGATEVAAWRLRSGPSAETLVAGQTTPRSGFETMLEPGVQARFAAVVALDQRGKPLGTSATIRV